MGPKQSKDSQRVLELNKVMGKHEKEKQKIRSIQALFKMIIFIK